MVDARALQADIEAASARIAPHVRLTPVIELPAGAFGVDARLALKLELMQHTASFKPRGAFNRLLTSAVPPSGVIAASGGNHGVAVAFAARQLGHAAEIFVPETASPVKVERLRRSGAMVRLVGARYADALAASARRAEETRALVVHAFDQPEVVAGQGTVGLELLRQAGPLDTVLVAVGGGGLIAGVAGALAGAARVVGVETEGTPTMTRALEAGRPVDVEVRGLALDSLGASRIGDIAFAVASRHVDRVALVEDDAVRRAQRLLFDELRLVVESGGAVALAALLEGAYRPLPGERVGVVICGGNTDVRHLA